MKFTVSNRLLAQGEHQPITVFLFLLFCLPQSFGMFSAQYRSCFGGRSNWHYIHDTYTLYIYLYRVQCISLLITVILVIPFLSNPVEFPARLQFSVSSNAPAHDTHNLHRSLIPAKTWGSFIKKKEKKDERIQRSKFATAFLNLSAGSSRHVSLHTKITSQHSR